MSSESLPSIRLAVRGVIKDYPGTRALDDVSIDFEAGKVHALLGKNGAGKSTMIKIIAGATQPTQGQVLLEGQPVSLHSPQDAHAKGIATVYQELSLIPGLTVAENILFGRLPKHKGVLGAFIDWRSVRQQAQAILDRLGVDLPVDIKVSRLGVSQQQVVEIAKAMATDPKVLLLDEPTSALADHESQALFRLIRKLASQGVAVIYISHRLQELSQIVDTLSVLRDGQLIGTVPMAEATAHSIADMMFGRVQRRSRPDDLEVGQNVALQCDSLTRAGRFKDVSFKLHEGEILGIAGTVGAGRTSLLMSLFGAAPPDSGKLTLNGKTIRPTSPGVMKRAGLAFTPEDRKHQALVQLLSVRDNLCMASLGRMNPSGIVSHRKQQTIAQKNIEALQIKTSNMLNPVSSLSGGNQQKVVIGNWLNTQPRVVLFDEPTRGIDLEAKLQVFQIIWDLSRQGVASIVVSSELEELLDVCHRILIMNTGRLTGEVKPQDTNLSQLLARCMEPQENA